MAKYQYGNRVIDGRTIDISQIPKEKRKAKEWACTCPLCGAPFIAVMGDKNEAHFRHKNRARDFECDINHANETGLHKMAKEIIQEAQKFHLPAYTIDRREIDFGDLPNDVIESLPEKYTYRKARWIQCDRVELEQTISDIVPDVVAYTPEGEYLIEIYVTNPVTQTKIEKAKKIGLPLLEVDLSDLKDKPISEENLRSAVIDSCDRTKWRYFPDREKALEEARAFYMENENVKTYRQTEQEEKRRKEQETTKVKQKPELEPEVPKRNSGDDSELRNQDDSKNNQTGQTSQQTQSNVHHPQYSKEEIILIARNSEAIKNYTEIHSFCDLYETSKYTCESGGVFKDSRCPELIWLEIQPENNINAFLGQRPIYSNRTLRRVGYCYVCDRVVYFSDITDPYKLFANIGICTSCKIKQFGSAKERI